MSPGVDVVSITLDVDWAPEEVLDQAIAMLDESGLKATFFATHESKVLTAREGDRFEIGLHPDFGRGRGDIDEPIADLKRVYPRALGARSHALFVSSPILQAYMRHGLRYESNIYLHLHEGLHPVPRFEGMVSLPFTWSDDKHLELGLPFRAEEARLDQPGLKVLNFHPIHLFMNTRDLSHYASYRELTGDVSALREHVNREGPGIADMFADVAREIADRRIRVARMCDLADG